MRLFRAVELMHCSLGTVFQTKVLPSPVVVALNYYLEEQTLHL